VHCRRGFGGAGQATDRGDKIARGPRAIGWRWETEGRIVANFSGRRVEITRFPAGARIAGTAQGGSRGVHSKLRGRICREGFAATAAAEEEVCGTFGRVDHQSTRICPLWTAHHREWGRSFRGSSTVRVRVWVVLMLQRCVSRTTQRRVGTVGTMLAVGLSDRRTTRIIGGSRCCCWRKM
jgi:hypothetical protein